MDIYLSFNNHTEIFQLPVLPGEFEVTTGLNNSTCEVIGAGEIGVIGNRRLSGITISSFFPKYYSSFCQYFDIPNPYDVIARIERWRDSGKPVTLAITGTHIKMDCMIEEFNYREIGGQPGDVYYGLSLMEYRFVNPRTIKQSSGGEERSLKVENNRPNTRDVKSPHTVKSGESLYVIAKKVYGDGSRYMEIYEKNKELIGPDPNLIYPGWELKV